MECNRNYWMIINIFKMWIFFWVVDIFSLLKTRQSKKTKKTKHWTNEYINKNQSIITDEWNYANVATANGNRPGLEPGPAAITSFNFHIRIKSQHSPLSVDLLSFAFTHIILILSWDLQFTYPALIQTKNNSTTA